MMLRHGLLGLLMLLQYIPTNPHSPVSGAPAGPTITLTSSVCKGNAALPAATCTLASSAAVGDLLLLLTKTESDPLASVAFTYAGVPACTPTAVISEVFQTSASKFSVGLYGCIVTTAGAAAPIATWTGASGNFTDIVAAVYHTTNTWKSTFVDRSASSVNVTSIASCPTGSTAATTTATDLVIVICSNFNTSETLGTLAGYTGRSALSTDSTQWFDKQVSATGVQSATYAMSAADFSVGFIAALASN